VGLLIAPGHRAALDIGGVVLFAVGGVWGQLGYWLRVYTRMSRQPPDDPPVARPWSLSTWGMALSILLTVGALGTAWVAADMPAGRPLTSAGGRVALVSFVLAVLLLGAGLAMIRLDSMAGGRGLSSSIRSMPKPSLWSRPPVIWLRRHPLFISAFVVAAGLRFAAMWAYRPALIFHGDSFGYLDNATRLLPNNLRPIVYPVFLHVLLHLHNLMVVTAVQHLMGLAVGVMVYALLRRLGVGPVLATLGALPVLFDAYQLNIEQYILTEPLFELLVVGAIVLVVWPKRPPLAACVGAGVLLAAATLTRTIGLVVILPVLAYVLVRRAGVVRATSLAVAFVVPLLAYGVWFHQNYGVYGVTAFDGYWLYGRVAQFADCSGMTLPTYEQPLCEQIPPSDRPGPNAYVWGGRSPLRRLHTPRGISHNAALKDFAVRIIEHQPLQYASTVGAELLHYFEPGRNVGPRDYPVRTWQFKPFRIHFDAAAQIYVIDGRFPVVDRPMASKLWTYQRFAYTTGPILGLALLLGLAGLVRPARRAARRLRAESLLFVSSGFLLLLVTEMTAMFDYRYLLPSLPFFGAAGALGAAMVLQRVRRLPADVPAPTATIHLDEASSPEMLSAL
jgi:hypothetical protein